MDQYILLDLEKILNEFCQECGSDKYKNCAVKSEYILNDAVPAQWLTYKGCCTSFKRKEAEKKTKPTIKNSNQQSLF